MTDIVTGELTVKTIACVGRDMYDGTGYMITEVDHVDPDEEESWLRLDELVELTKTEGQLIRNMVQALVEAIRSGLENFRVFGPETVTKPIPQSLPFIGSPTPFREKMIRAGFAPGPDRRYPSTLDPGDKRGPFFLRCKHGVFDGNCQVCMRSRKESLEETLVDMGPFYPGCACGQHPKRTLLTPASARSVTSTTDPDFTSEASTYNDDGNECIPCTSDGQHMVALANFADRIPGISCPLTARNRSGERLRLKHEMNDNDVGIVTAVSVNEILGTDPEMERDVDLDVKPTWKERPFVIEVFCGKGRVTDAAREKGWKPHPGIDKYRSPLIREGYQPHYDLSDKVVQRRLLALARSRYGPEYWMIAPPCTSFSNLMVMNGGTRTYSCLPGRANGPSCEKAGNDITDFIVELCLTLIEAEKSFILENPANYEESRYPPYPKLFDMPSIKKLMERPDVSFETVDMCMFGAGEDFERSGKRYHKPTGLMTNMLHGLTTQGSWRCDGVHEHIPVNGFNEDHQMLRSTLAGMCTLKFAREVCAAFDRDHRLRQLQQETEDTVLCGEKDVPNFVVGASKVGPGSWHKVSIRRRDGVPYRIRLPDVRCRSENGDASDMPVLPPPYEAVAGLRVTSLSNRFWKTLTDRCNGIFPFFGADVRFEGAMAMLSGKFRHVPAFGLTIPSGFFHMTTGGTSPNWEVWDADRKCRCTTVVQAVALLKAAVMSDRKNFNSLRRAHNPNDVRKISRRIVGFCGDTWDKVLLRVMATAVQQAAESSPDLYDALRLVSGKVLAESTIRDRHWGTGRARGQRGYMDPMDWPGFNVYGLALTLVAMMLGDFIPKNGLFVDLLLDHVPARNRVNRYGRLADPAKIGTRTMNKVLEVFRLVGELEEVGTPAYLRNVIDQVNVALDEIDNLIIRHARRLYTAQVDYIQEKRGKVDKLVAMMAREKVRHNLRWIATAVIKLIKHTIVNLSYVMMKDLKVSNNEMQRAVDVQNTIHRISITMFKDGLIGMRHVDPTRVVGRNLRVSPRLTAQERIDDVRTRLKNLAKAAVRKLKRHADAGDCIS